jgi:phage/plasmid-like protein (TIGR03299 family)
MIVGEPAWHGLGTPVSEEDASDWRKAYIAAGLDWEVQARPLFTAEHTPAVWGGNLIESHVANVRSSDSKVLGVVGKNYSVLQNEDVFAWFEPFLTEGQARFEAAGSLRGGSRIWALAKITGAKAEVREGDEVDGYLLLSHSHDGSLAVRVGFTPIRVVCNNTLTWAHEDQASQLIRIRHRGDVNANMRAVRETMDTVRQGFFSTIEQYRALTEQYINQADVLRYVELVLGVTRNEKGELATRTKNTVDAIVERAFHQDPRGRQTPGETVSAWDAYNGVTEWLTWERGRTQDTRINSLWYGDSAKLNSRALELAKELVVVR